MCRLAIERFRSAQVNTHRDLAPVFVEQYERLVPGHIVLPHRSM